MRKFRKGFAWVLMFLGGVGFVAMLLNSCAFVREADGGSTVRNVVLLLFILLFFAGMFASGLTLYRGKQSKEPKKPVQIDLPPLNKEKQDAPIAWPDSRGVGAPAAKPAPSADNSAARAKMAQAQTADKPQPSAAPAASEEKAPQQNMMEELSRLDTVYLTMLPAKDGRAPLPSLDAQGFVHVFSTKEAAEEGSMNHAFEVQGIPGRQMAKWLDAYAEYGVYKLLWMDNTVEGKRPVCELTQERLRTKFNPHLGHWLLRVLTMETLKEAGAPDVDMMLRLYRQMFNDSLRKALFIVPAIYEGEGLDDPVDDQTMHLFAHAGERITEVRKKGGDVVFPQFPYATQADSRPICFRLIKSARTGEEWLPCYLNLGDFLQMWKGRAHIALATYEDMKKDYAPVAKGLLINPANLCWRITPEMMEEIDRQAGQAQ